MHTTYVERCHCQHLTALLCTDFRVADARSEPYYAIEYDAVATNRKHAPNIFDKSIVSLLQFYTHLGICTTKFIAGTEIDVFTAAAPHCETRTMFGRLGAKFHSETLANSYWMPM